MGGQEGGRKKTLGTTEPGKWLEWGHYPRSIRAILFIESYCRLPKGHGAGELMQLAPWQKEWIYEVLDNDIRSATLSIPRGNGKSTLLAALATWAVFDAGDSGAPQVPVVATTVSQAIRAVYGVAVSMIEAEPELANRAKIYSGMANVRVDVPSTGGSLFPTADLVDSLQGLDPSLAVCDEIGFISVESWDALFLASGKRPHSLVCGIGTPGYDRENALWHIRQRALNGEEIPGFHYKEYSAPDGCRIDDREAWHQANPALADGYMAEDAMETAMKMSPEAAFRVFRLGQWADGVQSWLGDNSAKTWQNLTQPREFTPGEPIWVGVDVGLKRDSTAVVAVQATDQGYHAKARIWTPGADQPVDLAEVQQHLRELSHEYDLQAVSFDPRFFEVPAQQLADEGLPMIEVPQSTDRMTRACGQAYDLIRKGQVTHDGHELFTRHVLNAVPRYNQYGFALAKAKAHGPIDACIALCLALDRAHVPTRKRAPLVALV